MPRESERAEPSTRLTRIRERRRQHEEELLSVHWFTVAHLAARWGVSETTVRAIPAEQLPYKTFGAGRKLKRRRYHPDDVTAFEARPDAGVHPVAA